MYYNCWLYNYNFFYINSILPLYYPMILILPTNNEIIGLLKGI